MKEIISNEYFMLALTFGVYYASKTIQRRLGWVLFNPILVAIAIIIAFLLVMDIPYETYHDGARHSPHLFAVASARRPCGPRCRALLCRHAGGKGEDS